MWLAQEQEQSSLTTKLYIFQCTRLSAEAHSHTGEATCVLLFSQAQQLANFPLPDSVTPHLMQAHGSQTILLASSSELQTRQPG